jgi:inhibitor of cysteine peptidase
MKTKITIIGMIAVLVLLAGACSTALSTPKQTNVVISNDDFSRNKNIVREMTIPQGSTLLVDIPSNPSTGFSWTGPDIAEPAVVKLDDSKYNAPESQVVGAAGTQTWTFTAAGKGTTKVTMQYSRPWEGGEKSELTFEMTVTVQ